MIQETAAEMLRRKLYHISHHPSVKPIIAKSFDFHFLIVMTLFRYHVISLFRNHVIT